MRGARWLLDASRAGDRALNTDGHDQDGCNASSRSPRALQRRVGEAQFGRMNSPDIPTILSQGAAAVAQADVVLGLELFDTWGVINSLRDRVHRDSVRKARPDARVISIGSNDLFTKSNYQNFQRFYPSDLSIAGDAQATLPGLTDAVLSGMLRSRRVSNAEREARWRDAHSRAREQAMNEARYGWDASPVSTARLYAELWKAVKDRDWALVSDDGMQSRWARRLWPIDRHYQFIGRSGGAGLGYGAPAAVGAALAHRAEGRIAVNVQRDGDMMYTPGAFWTAAYHGIPLLTVTHNNQGYHQEFMHLQRMAARRQRGIDGSSWVGNELRNPDIDLARVASGMGVWAEGPYQPAILPGRSAGKCRCGEPGLRRCAASRDEQISRIPRFGNRAALVLLLWVLGPAAVYSQDQDSDEAVREGRALYDSHQCWQCHGYEGQGSVAGVRIAPTLYPFEAFSRLVRHTNIMPAYSPNVLSEEQLPATMPTCVHPGTAAGRPSANGIE